MEKGSEAGPFLGVLPWDVGWQDTQKMRTVSKEGLDSGGREMSCGWSRQAKMAFTHHVQ